MKKEKSLILQMFAEGAPSAAEGNGGDADVGAENASLENAQEKNIENENLNEGDSKENPDEESFENLIKGKYKEDFEKILASHLSEKDGQLTELSRKLGTYTAAFSDIGARYGIENGDFNEIMAAINKEATSFEEEAAMREGVTVEQHRKLREHERFQRIQAAQSEAQNRVRAWSQQGAEVKKTYPDFNFQTEMQNRDFVKLLEADIPVKTAYEVIHNNELITGAARLAAKTAEKNAVARIQQKAARPLENGVSNSPGAVINTAANLTKKERAELALRAQRGEKISF